ncbi:copper chaperone PCu(A)C [Stenotrophomonas sp. SORGH_AS_0321]|uniref:copper chaperone PCu(A)C n=1 Tax=Stenotrophomonas sp. SORGH_AS_0321 TaxID=3041787 RepID=UPI0028617547|nr:copper chaperone PCu(A)C [Stenotrophomonas sp. SORGH_AS_0321]MDR6093684.1 copper(I)-binding protein [Stenotrophomonas sp. SORGH_AS_0321]
MITKPCVGVLFALCAFAASGAAAAAPVACLQLKDGWARLPPGAAMAMTAGYGTIHNRCGSAVTIIGARSAAFGEVSLHETTMQGDVSRMQHLHHLVLPAGAMVELKPGGKHLMLMQAKAALKDGQALPLVLQLEGGGEAAATLQVRAAGR